jgi:DNA (cytosine-5)-methyltransferase 1
MKPVLSLCTGAGLLDRGFEAAGFCCVSAGDILWGRDLRDFDTSSHIFQGVIAGTPCQDFSKARRTPPTGYGLEMIKQFVRVVRQAAPEWFLLENVPGVPNVTVPGYIVQRLNLNASECGVAQNRLRCFQFGSRDGAGLVIARCDTPENVASCVMASDGKRSTRRTWPDFCALQGLPRDFTLPGLSQAMRYKLVGNGVPVPMARVVATAIVKRHVTQHFSVCVCDCGLPVQPGQSQATAACRKRMQRKRDAAVVTQPGIVTLAMSLTI